MPETPAPKAIPPAIMAGGPPKVINDIPIVVRRRLLVEAITISSTFDYF